MSVGGQEQSQTQTTVPWEGVQGSLLDLYRNANQAFAQSQAAGQGGAQRQAIQSQLGAAANAGAGAQATRNLADQTLRGDFLMPGSNPALQGAIDAAMTPIIDRYTQQIFPQISSSAIQQGAFGGSRQGVVESLAAQGLGRELANATGQITYGNYARERQNQMLAPSMFQQATGLELLPSQIYQNVASTEQGLPFQALNQLAPLLYGGGNYGTTTTTGSGGASPLAGMLGGAASGAGIASALSLGGPWGWGLAGLGGLLGAFG